MSKRAQQVQAQLQSWASENHELLELVWVSLEKGEGWPNARLLNRAHFTSKRRVRTAV